MQLQKRYQLIALCVHVNGLPLTTKDLLSLDSCANFTFSEKYA